MFFVFIFVRSNAFILNYAIDILGGIRFFGPIQAFFPATSSSIASVIAFFQYPDASSIILAGLFLSFAIFFNALLRSS